MLEFGGLLIKDQFPDELSGGQNNVLPSQEH